MSASHRVPSRAVSEHGPRRRGNEARDHGQDGGLVLAGRKDGRAQIYGDAGPKGVAANPLEDGFQEIAPNGASGCATLGCSIGIMAYNEAANIRNAIQTVLDQRVFSGRIDEVIVVASGCTDNTEEIVADIAAQEPRVRLIVQERREGKASAVNVFIPSTRSPLLLMTGADVLIKEGTVEALLRHFRDPDIGMVGGHPIPVNDESTFLGYAVHVLWRLHDRLAREAPKLGEIVAFRNVIRSIPVDTAVDEISIEALVTQMGYRILYDPEAIVYNRGPASIRDFLRQRRRIYAGHLRVRNRQDYAASTMSVRRIVRALRGAGCFRTPLQAAWTLGTFALEAVARGLGHLDRIRGREHNVWSPVSTTKGHIIEGANGRGPTSVLVFHMVDFHRQQLEMGVRASRAAAELVLRHIRNVLGANANLTTERAGTIIAVVFAERDEAERVALQIVESAPGVTTGAGNDGEGRSVQLSCGIIAFPRMGEAVAASIQPNLSMAISQPLATASMSLPS